MVSWYPDRWKPTFTWMPMLTKVITQYYSAQKKFLWLHSRLWWKWVKFLNPYLDGNVLWLATISKCCPDFLILSYLRNLLHINTMTLMFQKDYKLSNYTIKIIKKIVVKMQWKLHLWESIPNRMKGQGLPYTTPVDNFIS